MDFYSISTFKYSREHAKSIISAVLGHVDNSVDNLLNTSLKDILQPVRFYRPSEHLYVVYNECV